MEKKSVTQETASTKMSFLQLPGAEHEFGSSRVPSATSSVKSGSIHFATTVRMLAPVIWSRIQSRQKVCVIFFLNCCCLIIWRRFDVERLARPCVSSWEGQIISLYHATASLCQAFPGAKQVFSNASILTSFYQISLTPRLNELFCCVCFGNQVEWERC